MLETIVLVTSFFQLSVQRKLPVLSTLELMKVKQMIKLCKNNGWYHVKTKGSHRHFKHPKIPGKITIPGNYLSKELKPGIERQILKKIAV